MSHGAIILDYYMILLLVVQRIIKLKSGRTHRKINGNKKQRLIFKYPLGKSPGVKLEIYLQYQVEIILCKSIKKPQMESMK